MTEQTDSSGWNFSAFLTGAGTALQGIAPVVGQVIQATNPVPVAAPTGTASPIAPAPPAPARPAPTTTSAATPAPMKNAGLVIAGLGVLALVLFAGAPKKGKAA